MNKLALVGLLLSALPARADIVAVHGTAAFDQPLYDPILLAKIGYLADPQGTFEFSYSYSTTSQLSTGTFKLVHRDHNGAVIDADTIDLNPVTVGTLVTDDAQTGVGYDDYVAQIEGSRSGTSFLVGIELVDDNKTVFPALQTQPGVYLNNLGLWTRWILAIGVPDAACNGQFCDALIATVNTMSATVTPEIVDSDGDGVPDSLDKCQGASSGPVNADGCTAEQLVPCAGPKGGGTWKNHGQYLSQLAKVLQQFVDAGLMTEDQKDAILAGAGSSTCGKP